jgi:hypothetical protein
MIAEKGSRIGQVKPPRFTDLKTLQRIKNVGKKIKFKE